MDTLFQYMSFEKCFSILRNKALSLRNFMSYNDPFECLPEFSSYADVLPVYSARDERLRKEIINSQIDALGKKYKFTTEFIAGLKKGLTATSILAFAPLSLITAYAIGASVSSLFKNSKQSNDENEIAVKMELFFYKFIPCLMNLYTSCFTTKKDNILMWSHYAKSHKGVVMEFRPSYKPFTKGVLKKVNYDSKRFDFSIKDYSSNLDMEKLVFSLLATKGVDWKYEEEYRLIYDIKENRDEQIWRDTFNNPCVKLDYESIKSIYIGRRASEEDIQALKSILIEYNLDSKIDVHNVRLSHKGYKIEIL